jgi:protein tyrosine phosphatase type IVA
LQAAGIAVHELTFPDGTAPSDAVVDKFLKVLAALDKSKASDSAKPTVAVHCVAGLGRAPVLVAIALIESGMDPLDVIKEIRAKRPGALNVVQLKFLQQYKRRGKGGCTIQ